MADLISEARRYLKQGGNVPKKIESALHSHRGVLDETFEYGYGLSFEERARLLASDLLNGKAVILANNNHQNVEPVILKNGIGPRTNGNYGIADKNGSTTSGLEDELAKVKLFEEMGISTSMDLSNSYNLGSSKLWSMFSNIIAETRIPQGKVDQYITLITARERGKSIKEMTVDDFVEGFEYHAKAECSYITIRPGITRKAIDVFLRHGKKRGSMPIVSRGGAMITEWMLHHSKSENPYVQAIDKIAEIAKSYDVVVSLGDGFRPGSICHTLDEIEVIELEEFSSIADELRRRDVQRIVEGPGHTALHKINKHVTFLRSFVDNAPVYYMGPIVDDVLPGWDHLTHAYGTVEASRAGSAFQCYITPAEHIHNPKLEDCKRGSEAILSAVHAGHTTRCIELDSNKEFPERQKKMANARGSNLWQDQYNISVTKSPALKDVAERLGNSHKPCTICGPQCPHTRMMGLLMNREENVLQKID